MEASGRLRRLKWLVLVLGLLVLVSLFRPGPAISGLRAAPAKGGAPMDLSSIAALALDEQAAEILALSDAQLNALLAGKLYDFVYAVRLGEGEARAWQEEGCGERNCAHVTFYNYSDGGTIEAIVDLARGAVLSRWSDATSRPGPSENVLPRALDIAARDPDISEVLGDIRSATPAMVPMPIWLSDGPCSTAWCVDLTYFDPAGSGRVFHVVVNMEAGEVARSFFSRARPDRLFKRPEQNVPFEDGCHEQYGWAVCWEMTAHDGLNFRDAAFNGDRVFTSAKIGQTEVWYPAWPGGYRDEIGFRASVPPHFGTLVNDLGDGFEVRQLFTEFLRWPNCICCYRYEQVIRFFEDGAFELLFVSHGPGCEDLSNYRPFWRIELNQDDIRSDEMWVWDEAQWTPAEQEMELELFSSRGPGGQTLATVDRDKSYRWIPIPTDPLGLDEAQLFVLALREGEGDGPIATGPADTFQPPRQWMEEEPLAGEDLVLWYVPILKTKQDDPFWCMPDPEPDFSPCDAVLRVEPGDELTQPAPEELQTPTPRPTATPRPTPAATAGATVVPMIEGDDAETVIGAAGCGACHRIGDLGEAGKVGPDLTYMGLLAGGRVAGMSAESYIEQSIVDPNVYLAPFCPNGDCLANVMPRDYGQRLSGEQVALVVDYLMTLDYGPPMVEEEQPGEETEPGSDGEVAASPMPTQQPAEPDAGRPGVAVERSTLAGAALLILALILSLVLVALLRRL